MANDALRRSIEIENTLREDDRVKNCEVTLVETTNREHHIAKVLLKPEVEEIELRIDSSPIPNQR